MIHVTPLERAEIAGYISHIDCTLIWAEPWRAALQEEERCLYLAIRDCDPDQVDPGASSTGVATWPTSMQSICLY